MDTLYLLVHSSYMSVVLSHPGTLKLTYTKPSPLDSYFTLPFHTLLSQGWIVDEEFPEHDLA